LHDVRASVALLTNAALAREGIEAAVDHRTLEAQGISRDPARYGSAHGKAHLGRTIAYRQRLRESGTLAYEQLHTYAGWRDQAVQLLSLDRQYVKDLARDHVWRYDHAPAREREQEPSMERTFDLAMRDQEPTRQREPRQDRSPERTRGRPPTHTVARQLQGLAATLAHEDEMAQGAHLNVRLHEDRDHDRGIGW
jgi:hypothetical protein